jgi:hypothetical protein
MEALELQLAQPVPVLDDIHLAYLRGHRNRVARRHLCPNHHVPCADGHELESRAQTLVKGSTFRRASAAERDRTLVPIGLEQCEQ